MDNVCSGEKLFYHIIFYQRSILSTSFQTLSFKNVFILIILYTKGTKMMEVEKFLSLSLNFIILFLSLAMWRLIDI